MENTEIMTTNEEVMDVTEELAETTSGKALKVIAGVGLVVLAGALVYKYVAKPIGAKVRAAKEAKAKVEVIEGDFEECEIEENVD